MGRGGGAQGQNGIGTRDNGRAERNGRGSEGMNRRRLTLFQSMSLKNRTTCGMRLDGSVSKLGGGTLHGLLW